MKAFFAGLVSGGASKFFAAVAGAAAAAEVTGQFDWKIFVTGMITAVAVYLFPNKTPAATQEHLLPPQ